MGDEEREMDDHSDNNFRSFQGGKLTTHSQIDDKVITSSCICYFNVMQIYYGNGVNYPILLSKK